MAFEDNWTAVKDQGDRVTHGVSQQVVLALFILFHIKFNEKKLGTREFNRKDRRALKLVERETLLRFAHLNANLRTRTFLPCKTPNLSRFKASGFKT